MTIKIVIFGGILRVKFCLVAFSNHLDACLSVLNPELSISAIIVDNVKEAEKIVEKYKLPKNILFHYYNLKECLENLTYDYIITALRWSMFSENVIKDLYSLNISKTKFISLWELDRPQHVCAFSILMKYYNQNASKYKIFVTGDSHFVYGLNILTFSLPLINFARGSQDLYYDYKIAKMILNHKDSNFKYAIIGLSIYSFNWDVSQSYRESWRLLQYYLYFRDLHNNWIPNELYKNLFNTKFLNGGYVTTKTIDLNNVYKEKVNIKIGIYEQLRIRKFIDLWNKKDYPLTVEENKTILNNYLLLCKEKGVIPILVLPPVIKDCQKIILKKRKDQFYSILDEILKKFPFVKFLDTLTCDELDEYEDFYDSDHLNINGSKKYSQILNNYISNLQT